MKKIICIGECALDIVFEGTQPAGSMPGGRIVNASAIMAREGLPVRLVGEAAAGAVGDIICGFLSEAGVDCSSVDRFTEGLTPVNIFTCDASGKAVAVTRYEKYPDECFDVIWPRIDEGDIVVFGGFYALDPRMRPRMSQLLAHAVERKAVTVYLPGFMPSQEPRITRVMPAILENFEFASAVIMRDSDLTTIFGNADGENCYNNRISFYCRSLINADTESRSISYYCDNGTTSADIADSSCFTLMWNAGAVAGVIKALYDCPDAAARLESPDEEFRRKVAESAAATAARVSASLTENWQRLH